MNLSESMKISTVYVMIDESSNGNVFEEHFATESEAIDAAESQWERLLPIERKRRTISVGTKTIDMLDADNYACMTGEDLDDADASYPWWDGVADCKTIKILYK